MKLFDQLRSLLQGKKQTTPQPFPGSTEYWIERYAAGGDSAAPKFLETCRYKATSLNDFAREHGVISVLDFGCGEGVQAQFFDFPSYTGVDVSPRAIASCLDKMGEADNRRFVVADEHDGSPADMTMSLDVIYHLVEDSVFERYMEMLFDSARRYVAIFAPDQEDVRDVPPPPHVRYRQYSSWIDQHRPEWSVVLDLVNPYHAEEGKPIDYPLSRLRIYQRTRA